MIDTLVDFFRAGNVRHSAAVERRIEAIRAERPLHTDAAVTEPMRLLVEALLPQLRAVCAGIERFDAAIAELAPTLPDYQLFAALPGAGPALAPRLLVAFGERRERFPDAAALQRYAGVAPVTERSGNKSWGALALLVPHVFASDFRRVGRPNHPTLLLGKSLLRGKQSPRRSPSGRPPCARFQVDPSPSPLLDRPRRVR